MNWRLALAALAALPLILVVTFDIPPIRARSEPAHSNGDCAHQRVPAGIYFRA